jgi:hypothetical protein
MLFSVTSSLGYSYWIPHHSVPSIYFARGAFIRTLIMDMIMAHLISWKDLLGLILRPLISPLKVWSVGELARVLTVN